MILTEGKKSRKSSPFSETDLCASFIAALARHAPGRMNKASAWVAYPETGDFDILLVRAADGLQIGVEAKLSLNPHVVAQALPGWGERTAVVGPDHRAVLVPSESTSSNMATICKAVGVHVIEQEMRFRDDNTPDPSRGQFFPDLPWSTHDDATGWHNWAPGERIALPAYVPEVPAGVPAPARLTEWTIKAIKLAILLERRPVSRRDLKHLDLSPTTWVNPHNGWLVLTPMGYVWHEPSRRNWKKIHPQTWARIEADIEKWAPVYVPPAAPPEPVPVQQDLL